jgi:uncharacterized protein
VFDLYAPFIVGLLGSVHCLGMCGPLVVAYALHNKTADNAGQSGWGSWSLRRFAHHAAFHSGRIFIYGLLGAIAAGLFRAAAVSLFFLRARGTMEIIGGVVLVLLGLVVLKILPFPKWLTAVSLEPDSFWGRRLPQLLRSHRVAPKIVLGMATGLLPCGLSWAMVVTAAATQEPVRGGLTMVLFGVGTVPLLLLTGISAHLLSLRIRFLGERLAAITIIIMGVVMVARGISGHGCCHGG